MFIFPSFVTHLNGYLDGDLLIDETRLIYKKRGGKISLK